MANLEVKIGSLHLKNPIMIGSATPTWNGEHSSRGVMLGAGASVLKTLVPETVKAWCKNSDASELSVLLSEKDCKELEGEFKAALKAELSKGMEVKADKTLSAGFRIGVNNGAAYYDYSAEAVADLFTAYLNPRVAALMKNAAKGNN